MKTANVACHCHRRQKAESKKKTLFFPSKWQFTWHFLQQKTTATFNCNFWPNGIGKIVCYISFCKKLFDFLLLKHVHCLFSDSFLPIFFNVYHLETYQLLRTIVAPRNLFVVWFKKMIFLIFASVIFCVI